MLWSMDRLIKVLLSVTVEPAIRSHRTDIKALVTDLIEASVLYLSMVDDNERKEAKIVL